MTVMRFVRATLMLISLLLCIAAAVLWVRSYGGSDYVMRGRVTDNDVHSVTSKSHAVTWTRGQIQLTESLHTYYSSSVRIPRNEDSPPPYWGHGRLGKGHMYWELQQGTTWNRLGFATIETGWSSSFADERRKGFAFPAWLPAIVFGLWPALWLVGVIRMTRRVRAGCCRHCGYDLRATPGRCPECGRESR